MPAQRPAVHYRILPRQPEAHLFEVSVTVEQPDPAGQRFRLPAWIPGSYMIREFARHIVRVRANRGRRPVTLEKLDKHTWRAAPCDGPLTVTYEVYAWDLSVRGAHLDRGHGFFNGTSVFLCVLGHEDAACEVELLAPRGAAYRRWRVATALARAGASHYGFGRYRAASYDELIDHPVEMGEFDLVSFTARGVVHDIAVTGRHRGDLQRIARDLKRLTEHQLDFFGSPAPIERYVFLITVVGDGYGGLEHRASTALLCSRDDLPKPGVDEQDERYLTFLGLASHEYFHTWNVKRIKPAAFAPYDLTRENYTRQLWAFEGITSYYDDLCLLRCGLMTRAQYLSALARTLTTVQRGSGRHKQSVADSSFDAWIKYYRQDENAPNAIVSYYAKGALVALALDLTLRSATRGRRSLDDVMRTLWAQYGRTGRGVDEGEIEAIAERVGGVPLKRLFDRALRATADLPLAALLRRFGVNPLLRAATSPSDRGGTPSPRQTKVAERVVLGARTDAAGTDLKLAQVFDDGPAQAAGLSAGDVLVALDGLRVTASNLERLLARYRPGDRVRAHAFRRDELLTTDVTLAAAPRDTWTLNEDKAAPPAAKRLREAWLSPPAVRRRGSR